jgi:3-oxoacyl-[acyl-carrier-protein] synthase-3
MMGVVTSSSARIIGWGTALPDKIVTNADLEDTLDTSDAWIIERTGIRERRIGGTTTGLGVQAGQRALSHAGLTGDDIDLVVLCTSTPDEAMPASASVIQNELGVRGGAVDLNAACSGFVYGLVAADGFLRAGLDRVLLVGSEVMSRIVDWDDRGTAILFGDGAGAVVLGPTESGTGIGPIDLSADGGLADTIVATPDDPFIRMDGISTFKIAVKRLSESTIYAVSAAGIELDDIDLFVYHQANSRIIKAVGERLELDPAKVADYIAQLGNTSAASIPLTLSLSREDGRLRPGHKVLIAAIGAGFTWGAGVMEWSG